MRHMPAAFWRLRRLERDCRAAPGCSWVHRWISRRSLLLTSHWDNAASARVWLDSPAFRRFDAGMRARGAHTRIERAHALETL
ncbi:MAG: antibiotic biosynthesis monooxygenase [Dehalococcoidia bacterium]|nr:antibiotic biosynthesis monooxygenase [Dehalococcoidia bacterium]